MEKRGTACAISFTSKSKPTKWKTFCTHTNTAKSYDAITCVRIKYHHHICVVYVYTCTAIDLPLTFFCAAVAFIVNRIHFDIVVVELHVVLCTVFVCLFSWWFCPEMVLCSTVKNRTYLSQRKSTLTLNIVNARIVVCWRRYCYCYRCCCYCFWILLSFYSASLFVQFTTAVEFSTRFIWRVRTHFDDIILDV